MSSILIVDDLESIHDMLDAVIQPIGYNTSFAIDGPTALQKFKEHRPDITLVDIEMKPMNGVQLLKELKEIDPNAIVIMMSGYANVENATASLKHGAFDYLTKPFKVNQLVAAINRAKAVRNELANASKTQLESSAALVGDSPSAEKLRSDLEKLSESNTPLLLECEPGEQTDIIASTAHRIRFGGDEAPLIVIDCKGKADADLSDALQAEEGTVFLRSIDSLGKAAQSQLDKLIKDSKEKVRIICSTHQSLEALVEAGSFDESLFYRLSNAHIKIPPLRERIDDLQAISRSILESEGFSEAEITESARAVMAAYRWPGHLTELTEVLKAAAESAGNGPIEREHLPSKLTDTSAWPNLSEFIDGEKTNYMRRVLAACQNNAEEAAKVLDCDPSELEGL